MTNEIGGNTKPVVEYFDDIGHSKPANISLKRFKSIISLYESAYEAVPTLVNDEDDLDYICPVTGIVVRSVPIINKTVLKIDISKLTLPEQVDEMRNANKRVPVINDFNTSRLLANLTKKDGDTLFELIDNLLYSNKGVVETSNVGDYESFYRSFKRLEKSGVVQRVRNKLKKKNYISYKIAPYIAFKGSESQRGMEINNWVTEQARSRSKTIRSKYGVDFPLQDFVPEIETGEKSPKS